MSCCSSSQISDPLTFSTCSGINNTYNTYSKSCTCLRKGRCVLKHNIACFIYSLFQKHCWLFWTGERVWEQLSHWTSQLVTTVEFIFPVDLSILANLWQPCILSESQIILGTQVYRTNLFPAITSSKHVACLQFYNHKPPDKSAKIIYNFIISFSRCFFFQTTYNTEHKGVWCLTDTRTPQQHKWPKHLFRYQPDSQSLSMLGKVTPWWPGQVPEDWASHVHEKKLKLIHEFLTPVLGSYHPQKCVC